MSLRILAYGDHHFQQDSPRWQETLRVHETFAAIVERERPDLVLSGADWLERDSCWAERQAIREHARAVCRWSPLVSSRGNHDPKGDLGSFLPLLRTDHPLTLVEEARVVEALPGVAIATVAWPSVIGSVDDGVGRAALRTLLAGMGDQMRADRADYRILLGHFDVSGAKIGTGQPLIGGSLRVGLPDLALADAQAGVMSHVHKPQTFVHGEVPYAYCGSPAAHDWGEIEAKSFLDLRWDAVASAFVVERIPTGARRMLHASGRYDETLGDVVDVTFSDLGVADALSLTGAEVRLRYKVRPEHVESARRFVEGDGGLCDRWKALGACRVEPEHEIVTSTRARDGAVEVSAAPTLTDQMVAYWKTREDAPPPERQRAMLGLLAELGAR